LFHIHGLGLLGSGLSSCIYNKVFGSVLTKCTAVHVVATGTVKALTSLRMLDLLIGHNHEGWGYWCLPEVIMSVGTLPALRTFTLSVEDPADKSLSRCCADPFIHICWVDASFIVAASYVRRLCTCVLAFHCCWQVCLPKPT